MTFLLNNGNQGIEKSDINKVLRIGGFTTEQVMAIKLNDFRANQAEVLFEDGVQIDTQVLEEKLKKEGTIVIVSKFQHVEEYLMLYGLPLTSNIELMKEKIVESIKPFVKEVFSVVPGVHKGDVKDDFFAGNYNGNWSIKVGPKTGRQIPNFIVVGQEAQVMAKAVYTKKLGLKEEMCQDCFNTDLYRNSEVCPGPREWAEYCQEFKEKWETLLLEATDENDDNLQSEVEESRLIKMNKTLKQDLEVAQRQNEEMNQTAEKTFGLGGTSWRIV